MLSPCSANLNFVVTWHQTWHPKCIRSIMPKSLRLCLHCAAFTHTEPPSSQTLTLTSNHAIPPATPCAPYHHTLQLTPSSTDSHCTRSSAQIPSSAASSPPQLWPWACPTAHWCQADHGPATPMSVYSPGVHVVTKHTLILCNQHEQTLIHKDRQLDLGLSNFIELIGSSDYESLGVLLLG